MKEGDQPDQYDQQLGEEGSGSGPNIEGHFVPDLLERKRHQLQLGDLNAYVLMWSDLKLETGRGRVPSAVHEMVVHVSRGLDFLLFEKLRPTQQASIRQELAEIQQEERTDHITLTYDEGRILQQAAAAVNVAYDPGKPEELEKRTFHFSALKPHLPATGIIIESNNKHNQ